MDNQRLFLFVALSFVILLLWQAWVEDYGPPPAEVSESAPATTAPTPGVTGEDLPAAPQALPATDVALPEADLLKSADAIEVETDLFQIRIDTTGGDLRQADLLTY